jgi:hypothetical protein
MEKSSNTTEFAPGYIFRVPVHCTECDSVHAFPVPKFRTGQKVRIVSDGYNHKGSIGKETKIISVATALVMPCDSIEYVTTMGFGYLKESRLEAVE